jgi:peptide/nickel transport system permease protein
VFEPTVSEASPDVLADAFEPASVAADVPRRRRILAPTYPRAIALFIFAIALFVVGTKVLTKSTAEIRVVVCLVALYLGFRSLDMLGKRINGPSFPTGLWLSVSWLVIAVFAAAFSDVIPVAEAVDPSKTLQTPILLRPNLFSAHPLGTDRFGLDILGGVMHGLQVSLIVGLGAVSLALVVGGSIGVVSGYFRGGIDKIADTVSNALLAFPPLIFLLALVAVVPRSVTNVTWALAVLSTPVFYRLARANTFVIAQRESVLAARALGATKFRVIVRELVPPVAFSLLAYSFVLVAVVIIAEASLSFLGLSVPRPEPTLGNMIAANQANLDQTPALVFIPATVLFITVLSLNRVGEYARVRWTPKEAKV